MAERKTDDAVLFPPGTLYLERILDDAHQAEVILHPTPTNDPNDPLNWPIWYKVLNFSVVCFYTLMVFVNLSIGTVVWAQITDKLGISYTTETVSFGLNCVGLAIGCIIFTPFALKFGRRIVFLFSIAVSILSAVWMASLMTGGDMIGASILSGLFGAVSETICQMTIADVFFVHQRGAANAVYMLMVDMGAFLSLVPAGYSAASQGWRWPSWWATILLTVCFCLVVFLYEDTKYTPSSGSRPQSSALERESSQEKPDKSKPPPYPSQSAPPRRKSYFRRLALLNTTPGWSAFFRHMYQPFIIVATFPAVAYTALTYGSLLAWYAVCANVFSVYFTLPPYNFDPIGIGLMNIPPFIGGLLGALLTSLISDRSVIWLSRRNDGVFEPEMRLWTAIPGAVIMPISLLWFGLTTAYGLPWIIPAMGLAFFGFAFAVLGGVSLTYAMDCYDDVIGDAFVGTVFVRNVFSAIIGLTLTSWIDGVGLVNMFVMSTVFAAVLSALLVPMMIRGKKMRIRTAEQYEFYSARQYVTR